MVAASAVFSAQRFLVVAVLVAVAGPAAYAQVATLRGTVEDAASHQPIARALVTLQAAIPAQLTDPSGHFSFANVPVGSQTLQCRRPGYYDPQSGNLNGTYTITLAADTQPLTLQLAPLATLRGQVTVAPGDTPSGINVTLYSAVVEAGFRHWRRARRAATVREDGSFTFGNLMPGDYIVHAEGSLDPVPYPAATSTRAGYPPVFAPDSRDPSAATVFTLAPGATAEAEIQLSRAAFYPVTLGSEGWQGFGAADIDGNGFIDWRAGYSGADQSFHTWLPTGAYTARIRGGTAGSSGSVSGVDLTFQVDAGPLTGPSFHSVPGAPLSLTVHTEAGSSPGQAAPRPTLLDFDPVGDPLEPAFGASIEQQNDGSVRVAGVTVRPGRYWVTVQVSGGYVFGLSSGSTSLLTSPLTVAPGTALALSVTLRDDVGSLLVTCNGAAAAPAFVQLIPLSSTGVSWQQAITGATTSFKNLAPGDYLVFATAGRIQIPWREPGALTQLQGERVTIVPNQGATATLDTLFTPPPGTATQ